jgi:phage/plasmid-like protein (TIGR03299 family)
MSANVKRMAYVGEQPWWIGMRGEDRGQATELKGYATAAEMMKVCGMDFRLGKSPMLTYASKAAKDAGEPPIKVPERYAIIRSDTLQPLPGVAVGEGYEVIDFPTMFSVCDELTSRPGYAHYETAGLLFDGRVGWGLVRLDKSLYIADDEIRTFLLATTAHDGSSSLRCKVVNTRVVCCNTFAGAMGEKGQTLSIRHTKNYAERIEAGRRMLALIPKEREQFEAFAKELLAKPIGKETYRKLVEVLFPVPEDLPGRELTSRMITNVNKKRTLLAEAAQAPDLDAVRWTAWGAYNAVADLEQHLLTQRNGCDDNTKVARMFERSFERDELTLLAAKFLAEV